jgi:hypothetical protein
VVPTGCAAGLTVTVHIAPFGISLPGFLLFRRAEVSVKRETELILASASPRKPRLIIASRSSSEAILLVA